MICTCTCFRDLFQRVPILFTKTLLVHCSRALYLTPTTLSIIEFEQQQLPTLCRSPAVMVPHPS